MSTSTKMTSDSKLSLKLLIDTKAGKVLFAEADKDFVDFLLHILSLPVSTVIRLLKKDGMSGCLFNLYESVENMNDTYVQSKDILLKPKPSIGTSLDNPFLLLDDFPTLEKTFYGCNNTSLYSCSTSVTEDPFYGCNNTSLYSCSTSVTEDPEAVCQKCGQRMSKKLNYIASKGVKEGVATKGGFVKEAVAYMVMDDLVVKPLSTTSIITLLNKFNVQNVSVLQEKVVYLGMKEALKMLKASFESKTVLTSVFISGANQIKTENKPHMTYWS